MTPLERALIALARRLSEIKVSYMLVGGMAKSSPTARRIDWMRAGSCCAAWRISI